MEGDIARGIEVLQYRRRRCNGIQHCKYLPLQGYFETVASRLPCIHSTWHGRMLLWGCFTQHDLRRLQYIAYRT